METICSINKMVHTVHQKEVRTILNGACTKKGRTTHTKAICQTVAVAPLKMADSQHLGASEGMNPLGNKNPLSSLNAQLAAFCTKWLIIFLYRSNIQPTMAKMLP